MKELKVTAIILTCLISLFNESSAQWSTNGLYYVHTTTSSDNVGIGATTPSAAVHVTAGTTDFSPNINGIQVWGGASAGIDITNAVVDPQINFKNDHGAAWYYDARLRLVSDNYVTLEGSSLTVGYSSHSLGTDGLAVSGDVGIGTSTPSSKFHVSGNEASYPVANFWNYGDNTNRYGFKIQCGKDDQSSTSNYYLRCYDGNGTEEGGIMVSGGTFGLYNYSDKRLKTNISNTIVDGIETLNNLRVVDYNWERNPTAPVVTGFIAQEVQEVYPAMVGESPETGMLNITPTSLIPVMVKALQEQQKLLDARAAVLNDHENQLVILEKGL